MATTSTGLYLSLSDISSQLDASEAEITSSVSLLNSLADSANTATVQADYDSYVEQWTAEKSTYDSLYADYTALGGEYTSAFEIYSKVYTSEKNLAAIQDIPNYKDENQWRAGGYLQNQKLGGGLLYNPTEIADWTEKPIQNEAYHMKNGTVTNMLNTGFTEIQNTITGFGFLDLFRDYRELKVVTYEISVLVENTDGSTSSSSSTTVTETIDQEGGGDAGSNVDFGVNEDKADMSTQDWEGVMSTEGLNLTSTDLSTQLVTMAVKNLISGKEFNVSSMSVKNLGLASLQATATSVFSQQMTVGLAKTLGLTSVTALSIVNIALNLAIGELFEVLTKQDNHYGFGGQRIGYGGAGANDGLYSAPSSLSKVAADTFSEISGFFSGKEVNTDTYNPDINNVAVTNLAGDVIGFQSTSGLFTGQEMQSFKDEYGNEITNISDAISSVTSGQLNSSDGFGVSNVGDSNGLGKTNTTSGLGAGLEGVNTGGLSSVGDTNNNSGTTGSSRHCCTVLVKRRVWRLKKLQDLGVWDKKQNKIWRVGYQIGGKMVAQYYDRDHKIADYTKMMDAFYDTHVLGKKRTYQVYKAYLRIYPMVYTTGIYAIVKNFVSKIYLKKDD